MTEYWYRTTDGESDWPFRPITMRYEVSHYTPKGVKLRTDDGLRFVLNISTKRFADPTVVQAMQSYIARKKRQAQIYTARAKQAEGRLAAAYKQLAKPEGILVRSPLWVEIE